MKGKRGKRKRFSTVLAVKANARTRVGQPKPTRALPAGSAPERAADVRKKHKPSLGRLLSDSDE